MGINNLCCVWDKFILGNSKKTAKTSKYGFRKIGHTAVSKPQWVGFSSAKTDCDKFESFFCHILDWAFFNRTTHQRKSLWDFLGWFSLYKFNLPKCLWSTIMLWKLKNTFSCYKISSKFSCILKITWSVKWKNRQCVMCYHNWKMRFDRKLIKTFFCFCNRLHENIFNVKHFLWPICPFIQNFLIFNNNST